MKLLTENNMGLLFKADSRGGRNLHMLLNQGEGGVENPAKYKVEFVCTLLSNSLNGCPYCGLAKIQLIKCSVTFWPAADCKLEMTAINCEHTVGKSRERGG